MSNIDQWKFACDLFLMFSLAFLSFRFLKSTGSQARMQRLRELESGMRSLIDEAERAGRDLNDQLLRRQKSLEQVLTDIGDTEQRIGKTVSAIDERVRSLESETTRMESRIEKSKALVQESITQNASASQTDQSHNYRHSRQSLIPERVIDKVYEPEVEEFSPEPPSFVSRSQKSIPQAPQVPAHGRATARYLQQEQLSAAIEKQSYRHSRDMALERNMRAIQDSAERVIKSSDTAVPQARAIEFPEWDEGGASGDTSTSNASPKAADPRLGVLGGIRRQTQVL